MRVALACPYAWDDPGGVQVHVGELADALMTRGHEVLVLAPARTAPTDPWVLPVGSPIDVPYNASNAPIDPRPWSRRAVRHALATFVPDVVHAHQPTVPSTGLWATLEARAPVVATFHSGAARARLYDVAAPVLRRALARIAVRIAVSERAAAFDRDRLGGEFRVIPNGVDVARWGGVEPADLGPGRKLLFVGRLDARKGFRVAIGAFERLARHRDDLRLVVVGDGPERAALERLAPANAQLAGHVLREELPEWYAAADAFVLASRSETWGMALGEAAAAGLPLVASEAVGAAWDLVEPGVNGFRVPVGDVEALRAALTTVATDAAFRARAGARSRELAAAATPEAWAAAVAGTARKLAGCPPPSSPARAA